MLSLSVRQARRLQRRLERKGDVGVAHRLRGKPSNARLASSVRKKAHFGEIFQHFSHNITKVVSMPSSENPNERPEKLSYEEQSSSSRDFDRTFNFGCLIVVVIIVIGIAIFIAISWRSGDLVPLQK